MMIRNRICLSTRRLSNHSWGFVLKRSLSTLVIGGGPAGLAALKELKQEGLNPTLFEYSNDIGGQWNVKNPLSAMYPTLRSNTNQELWFYSDYPWINDNNSKPKYGSLIEYHNHMKSYAQHFNLYDNIRFNTNVKQVTLDETTNKWCVNYVNTDNNNDLETSEVFDKIVVCSGIHNHPHMPDNLQQNLDNFEGISYHSSEIGKIPMETLKSQFKNKNIAIIGGSISGVDACENIITNICDINENSTEQDLQNDKTQIYFMYKKKFSLLKPYLNKMTVDTPLNVRGGEGWLDDIQKIFYKHDFLNESGVYLKQLGEEEVRAFKDPTSPKIPHYANSKSFPYHCIKTKKIKGVYGNPTDFGNNSIYYEPIHTTPNPEVTSANSTNGLW